MPRGTFTGTAGHRRYIVTRHAMANGRAWTLVAEELGGPDYISLNLYRLARGTLLRPCEMPRDKVVDFVLSLKADPA